MTTSDVKNATPIRFDVQAFARLFPELKDADLTQVGALLEQAYVAAGKSYGADLPLVQFEQASNVLVVQLPAAPEIIPPLEMDEVGGDGMMALLGWLQSETTGQATAAHTLKLQGQSEEFQRQADLAESRRQESYAAADQAAKAAEESKHGKNALVAFGFIAAALTAAVAFVFGGPALAVVAAAGLTMAILDTVNTAMQNANVMRTDIHGNQVKLDISIGGLVQMSFEADEALGNIVVIRKNADGQFVDGKGNVIPDPRTTAKPGARVMTQEQYNKDVMAATIAITVFIAVAMLTTGIGGARMAAKEATSRAADMVGKINKFLGTNATVSKAETLAAAAESAAAIAESVTGGVSAGLDGKLAGDTLHLAETNALKKHLEAMINVLAQESEMTRQVIEKLINDLTESLAAVAKAIGSTGESMDRIARSISTPA